MKIITILALQAILFPQQNDISLDVSVSPLQKPWAFIAPHENENIVNDYVAEKIMRYGGVFVVLRQNGERHVTLTIDGNEYEIDPNRIFTNKGRRSTLSRLNKDLQEESVQYTKALSKTESLANFILDTMGAQQATSWIAVHNNTDGYDDDGRNGRGTVSIKRYQKKLDSGANYLMQVHDAGIDEDDLFFITHHEDLKVMAQANWNVVLQNPEVANDPSEDDGSLSVLAEMEGKRYINVEAERSDNGFGSDHVLEQKAMVDLTFELLKGAQ
jgi:hypothetical protein